jgi:tRNA A37 threonylcarbamoyltransferase TsaD
LLSGGVAANKRLVEKFKERFEKENLKTKFFAPLPRYCTDNAAVIASAAYFNNTPVDWRGVAPDSELTIDSPTLMK